MKIVTRLLLSVFSVLFAIVWAVQATGVLGALILSFNNVETTTRIIIAVSVIMSVIGIVLVWLGKISSENTKATKYICNAYFASLIALVVIYMLLIGDIKYVLLAECAATWVIWFVILGCIRKIEETNSKVVKDNTSETQKSEG